MGWETTLEKGETESRITVTRRFSADAFEMPITPQPIAGFDSTTRLKLSG